MKVRDGNDVSHTLISYITGFQNQIAQHGMDTMLHDNAAFPDRYKADGTTLTEAFTLLDRFLAQLLIGKLSPEVRTVYLAQRASEATAHFKAHSAAHTYPKHSQACLHL
jgi:hypothetical protein